MEARRLGISAGMFEGSANLSVNTVAEIVRLAVAPVFLLSGIGAIYTDELRTNEAIDVLRESLAVVTGALPKGDARIAVVQNYLAQALLSQGDYPEAESLINEARTVLEKSSDRRLDYALTLSNLGVARHLEGRDGEAILTFNESVRLLESSIGADHPILVRVLNNQATAYTGAGSGAGGGTGTSR